MDLSRDDLEASVDEMIDGEGVNFRCGIGLTRDTMLAFGDESVERAVVSEGVLDPGETD
jgi:hypothetical protein